MKHITILYPEEQCALSTVACIIGTMEVFAKANDYWKKQGNKEKCRLVVAGTLAKEEYVKGLVAVKTDMRVLDIEKTDLVIIPSAISPKKANENQALLDWIK